MSESGTCTLPSGAVGVAFGSTMVPCVLDVTFSPAQEWRAGLAAALLVSLNSGKDLKGKDACFQSLKIYYIYYMAKEGVAL